MPAARRCARHEWAEGYELLRAADETLELAPRT